MKRKIFTFCLSTGFAFALSMGAVGCLITGFDLALQKESTVIFACLISAVIGSGLLQITHGGKILAALTLLAGGLLWFRPDAQHQLLSLIGDVTLMYHRAYEWGWLEVGSRGAAADLPMAFLGTLVSLSACRTLCLGKGSWLTVVLGALPLAACLVVTNTVPQKTFLFCLLAPLILLILTSYVRQEDAPQGNRLTAMAALPVILALAGLFLAIPQEGYVNRSEALRNDLLHYIDYLPQIMEDTLAEVASEIQGEEIKNVNLRDLGPKPRYTHKVMEVTAETDGLLYLRGQDFDLYDGNSWTATRHRTESFSAKDMESIGDVTIRTRRIRDVLYLPYYPGSGIALMAEGLPGMIAGAVLSLLVLLIGKESIQGAVLKADIPESIRKMVPKGYFRSRLKKVSSEVKASFYESLETEQNEAIIEQMVSDISVQIEQCLHKMAEVVEIPLG